MQKYQIAIPSKLIPVFTGQARYRCAYGGRGSGKTRSFAIMAAVRGIDLAQSGRSGLIVCGREYQNTLSDSSMMEVKHAIQSVPWLSERYEVLENIIRTKDKRIEFIFCGLRHNIRSLKSKSKIHVVWVDEAEQVSEEAWDIIDPTIREAGSELWVTWNPERKGSPTDKRFRQSPPGDAKVTMLNWQDNERFPDVLNRVRLTAMEKRPDSYAHIWEGDYVTVSDGAYYAKSIVQAKSEGRISNVAADPIMTVRLFADIGGTGAKADNFVFWACQFIGREIRVINHYEVSGQPLSAHIAWLRSQGYTPEKAQIWLPHDGATYDKVHAVSYESALSDAGYSVTVIPNQGRGAAMLRVEATRRLFPSIWFNEPSTQSGIDALSWYHPKIDKERNIDLGPDHDWSSHSADAFGLMCVAYEEPIIKRKAVNEQVSWMG